MYKRKIKNSPGGRCHEGDCLTCDMHCPINMGDLPDYETDSEINARNELYDSVKNSSDEQYLYGVIKTCRELHISKLAANRISDETLLCEIAKTSYPWSTAVAGYDWSDLQNLCVDKINSQELLKDLAQNAPHQSPRAHAAAKLTDTEILEGLAKSSYSQISMAASKRLRELVD